MIHTYLIAAITADGFIAKSHDHPATWTSKEDKKLFVELTKRAGVMVMGANTYRTIGKALPGRMTIVYSREAIEGIETTTKSPRELLADLAARGYSEVAVVGGATIYTLFMEAHAIDTLYLTIEPKLFGQGLSLFNKPLDIRIELVSHTSLSPQTVLLEYKVLY